MIDLLLGPLRLLAGIAVLGVLIVVHELGHFLVAKFFGVGVSEFAVGFGKPLFRKRYGETFYSIRAIPLGGYVKMVGDDPTMVADAENDDLPEIEDEVEQRMWEDKSRWFLNKSYIPKFLIVLAGPAFNVFFAVFMSIVAVYIYGYAEHDGKPLDPVIGNVSVSFGAYAAGVQEGDRILSLNGEEVKYWKDLAEYLGSVSEPTVEFEIERDGKPLILEVEGKQLDETEAKLAGFGEGKRFLFGIGPKVKRKDATLGEALTIGPLHIWFLTTKMIEGLTHMFTGAVSPDSIHGPLFILETASQTAKQGVESLIHFMNYLGMTLAILNLLPIPVLDGGHLVMFTLEKIKGRALSLKARERANQVGVVFLLSLMVFALGNDIFSFVTRIFG